MIGVQAHSGSVSMLWAKGGYCSQIGRVSIDLQRQEQTKPPATFNLLISNTYETA